MNAFKLIGALGFSLAALAAAAQAAPAGPTANTLRQSAAGSDLFSRTADGSTERPDAAAPAFTATAESRAARGPGLFSSRSPYAPRSEVPPSAFSARSVAAADFPLRRDPLAAAGVLGTGLFLAIGAMFLRHSGPSGLEPAVAAPETYAIDPVISALATPGGRAPVQPAAFFAEPAPPLVCAPRPAARLAEPYVDTRMPVGTWRAISRDEQALIERWDASREKALGQASLEQWLERHPAAGVDVSVLQTKLARA